MLEALGHKQHAILVKTDNSTAVAFSNSLLKEKRSKSWDMRLHWLKDRVRQKHFYIFWDKGANNMADYATKHFTPSYHQKIRSLYVHKTNHIHIPDMWARVCSYSPILPHQGNTVHIPTCQGMHTHAHKISAHDTFDSWYTQNTNGILSNTNCQNT